jgi:hypothetical protein
VTAGGKVKDRQRNVVAAAYSGGNSVTKVEHSHYSKPPYPADTECRRLAVTKLATVTGAETRTQTRVETAGENLQIIPISSCFGPSSQLWLGVRLQR